jgi:putative DeoR family transcriptional regulator (stage III sporulation protein D)
LKGYIEERAVELANYIVEKKATVRAAAKKFGISKSTVHTVIVIRNGILILFSGLAKRLEMANDKHILERGPISIGGEFL